MRFSINIVVETLHAVHHDSGSGWGRTIERVIDRLPEEAYC